MPPNPVEGLPPSCDQDPPTCNWLGHCLGDPCAGFNDCNHHWICIQNVCALECSNPETPILPPSIAASLSSKTASSTSHSVTTTTSNPTTQTTPSSSSSLSTGATSLVTTTTDLAAGSAISGIPVAGSTPAIPEAGDDDSLSTGAAIGVGIAIPAFVALVAALAFFIWRSRRRSQPSRVELPSQEAPQAAPVAAKYTPPSAAGGQGRGVGGFSGGQPFEAGGTNLQEMVDVSTVGRAPTDLTLGPIELEATDPPAPSYSEPSRRSRDTKGDNAIWGTSRTFDSTSSATGGVPPTTPLSPLTNSPAPGSPYPTEIRSPVRSARWREVRDER